WRDQCQPRGDRKRADRVSHGARSHSRRVAAGAVRCRGHTRGDGKNSGGPPDLRPDRSRRICGCCVEDCARRPAGLGQLDTGAQACQRQTVVQLPDRGRATAGFSKVFGMQGVGKTKEAGTKAWGRPFWTMLQGLSLTLPLGGCLLTGGKPEPALDIPPFYTYGPHKPVAAEAAVPPLDWWRAFRSRELTEVIAAAREGNLDIAAAVAALVQAAATARSTRAALLPTVDRHGSASRIRTSQTTAVGETPGSLGGSERDLLSTSLTASYEIDFWGKNRSALRRDEELAVASRYAREVVGLTTVVTTANAYFQVLAAQDRLRVARNNVASATRVLN